MPLPPSLLEKHKWIHSDNQFNHLYPSSIKLLAQKHWSPVAVARKAAVFLASEKGAKILDIGSGAGKFCLIAGLLKPQAEFFGIEQRKNLIDHAETAKAILQISNVSFIHGNITQLKFNQFNHFYFYNSFYENLPGTHKIDDSIPHSNKLYSYYHSYYYRQMEQMPSGTRLATYHCPEDELPPGFHMVGTEMEDLLKFWIKE